MSNADEMLRELARQHGVQTGYWNIYGEHQEASNDALMAVLRGLGAPVERAEDASDALAALRRERWRRVLEPTSVVWDGGGGFELPVRLSDRCSGQSYHATISLESGEIREQSGTVHDLPERERQDSEGDLFVRRALMLAEPLPVGYHRLALEVAGERHEVVLIAAPESCYQSDGGAHRRAWGMFAPLYGLRSARSDRFGGSDLGDLRTAVEWGYGLGATTFGTLPLLAGFFDEPCDPSPYLPVSRLFWNELFVDLGRVPELEACAEARRVVESSAFARESAELAAGSRVEYKRLMVHRRKVLELLMRSLYQGSSDRRAKLDEFLAAHPAVDSYARFRAVAAERKESWRVWPERLRGGEIRDQDFDPWERRYHLYAQWIVQSQLESVAARAREHGLGLYLDLPVGVHPDGYDAWSEQELFAPGLSVGAPPDELFRGGQDWAIPALHPHQSRLQGHRYFRASLAAHLRHAGVLRVDHVMGLHRAYWVPKGMGPREGVYVNYPADDLFAIMVIESHRHRSVVVGEDLGTVPDSVRHAMARHRVHRMYVAQFCFTGSEEQPLHMPQASALAALNTHDTATFAGFWRGRDIEDRLDLELIDEKTAEHEREGRIAARKALLTWLSARGHAVDGEEDRTALAGALAELAGSDAWMMLVTLEDLWLEQQQQNVPGTLLERPNWQCKLEYRLDELAADPEIAGLLAEVARRRAPA